MILSAELQKTTDAYLAALRRELRTLRPEDANEIVEEIRGHILDKSSEMAAEQLLASTLAALGTPEELAARYRTDELLRRGQETRSPFVSLYSLARWATLSLIGAVTFFVSTAGYTVGTLLVVVGLHKLIYPHNGGIWFDPKPGGHGIDGSAGFSFISGGTWTHPGHEMFPRLLGPGCFAIGALLVFLTFLFGTWCLRKFWQPSALGER